MAVSPGFISLKAAYLKSLKTTFENTLTCYSLYEILVISLES